MLSRPPFADSIQVVVVLCVTCQVWQCTHGLRDERGCLVGLVMLQRYGQHVVYDWQDAWLPEIRTLYSVCCVC